MNVMVAIPVYNEARHLRGVLAEVRRYAERILVIDDGSTDQTSDILADIDAVSVIRHGQNLGYGQSLIDAFNYAICHQMDWLITMDCDGQHEPESIPAFLAAAGDGDCDIVSGSRYLTDDDDGASLPPPDPAHGCDHLGIAGKDLLSHPELV